MADDLIDVYEAQSLVEAHLLRDRLAEAKIEAFIDNVDSPLDGLVAGDQSIIVRVLPQHVDTARIVVARFEQESKGD